MPTYTWPSHGTTNWDAPYEANLNDIDRRILGLEALPATGGTGVGGWVNVDSFSGATDTAKLQAFITYHNAQTFKPLGRLSNRQYNWAGPITLPQGLTLAGPDFEREYKSTTSYENMNNSIKCRVSTTSTTTHFWAMPTDVSAVSFANIHFDGGGQGHDLVQNAVSSGNLLYHSRWQDFGVTNYRHAFYLTVQGGSWKSFHINSLGGHAFHIAGADYTVGSMHDYQYIDNCGPGLEVCNFYGDSGKILHLYITGRKSANHIIHSGGSGTLYLGNNLDSAGQDPGYQQFNSTTGTWSAPDPTWLCQGSLMQLNEGSAIVIGTRMFGGMYNPGGGVGGATKNKGLITANGGDHQVIGTSFETQKSRGIPFTKWYSYPSGTPHLYVTNGARVTVSGLKLVNDSLVYTSKTVSQVPTGPPSPDTLRLKQQSSGNIVVDLNPFVSIG